MSITHLILHVNIASGRIIFRNFIIMRENILRLWYN